MGVTARHRLKIGYTYTSGSLIGQGTLQESGPLMVLCSLDSIGVTVLLLHQHNIVLIQQQHRDFNRVHTT